MTKNKRLFCSSCYEGKVVRDNLTNVLFCDKCYEEYEIPLFEKRNRTSRIIKTEPGVNGQWHRPCDYEHNDFYRG